MQPNLLEQNRAVVRGLFDAWDVGDIAGACRLVAQGCDGGVAEGFRHEPEAFLTAFSDLQITLEDMLAEAEKVATRVTMRGTHQGVLFGIPAAGRAVVMKANHLFWLQNRQIVQRHGQMDRLELMQQLGMKLVPQDQTD